MSSGHNRDHVFHLEGQRFELGPSGLSRSEHAREPVATSAERRLVLTRLADEPAGRATLRIVLAESGGLDARSDSVDVMAERVLKLLERGQQVLWRALRGPVTMVLDLGEFHPPDLTSSELAPEEEDEDEAPLHVLVRIHYDPDRPEAWDDRLRLFTSHDQGGTYDQTVDLASTAQTQRDDRTLLVLFRDMVPDQDYSCFLDLGATEGGYLVFHSHRLGRMHHVPGLPRDQA